MPTESLQELKDYYRQSGARTGIKLGDDEMRRVISLLPELGPMVETPPAELRYIEGLLRLPLGAVGGFWVIPASGGSPCPCGRTPTALDIVAYAVNQRVHEERLLRDTVLGVHNVFEFADEGRTAPCHVCGREFTSRSYWIDRHKYLYA
ncbi:hypothetical protein Ssi03_77070 [Sphaerisporangium siamense]|uniref:Uncharacterized protein n=1 Tax=Sphaerisporangium siamense TaxID=795645 RepID=A0A7W7DAA3_9ACTN|nr:hypothetical protein [Sphaerisporangium siamense]MBB4702275.1 hypothetical protein [Sphaerisporangium siamense]GII89717.1 hypothetical protein Ssi03_77070 [Sphaerisporangium siamense]